MKEGGERERSEERDVIIVILWKSPLKKDEDTKEKWGSIM